MRGGLINTHTNLEGVQMKIIKHRSALPFRRSRSGPAWLALLALLTPTFSIGSHARIGQQGQSKPQAVSLSEEQRISHVLNRLGFGARPGDVERVQGIGIQKYIEQQLNPSQISDEIAEAKVKNLSTLTMTTAQLYEKYPQPGQILRQLQRRGELSDDAANPRAKPELPGCSRQINAIGSNART